MSHRKSEVNLCLEALWSPYHSCPCTLKKKTLPQIVAPEAPIALPLCLAFGFLQVPEAELIFPAAALHGERKRFIKDSSLRVTLSPNPRCFV